MDTMTIIQVHFLVLKILRRILEDVQGSEQNSNGMIIALNFILEDLSPDTVAPLYASHNPAMYLVFKREMLGAFPDGRVSKDKGFAVVKKFLEEEYDEMFVLRKKFDEVTEDVWNKTWEIAVVEFKDVRESDYVGTSF